MTDPGAWTTAQNEVTDIDLVLITHEHPDHLHLESLKAVLKNNPQVRVITNSAVGKILSENAISFDLVEDGQEIAVSGLVIRGFGKIHAEIYGELNRVQNTGYFVGSRFFYPGDALTNPQKPVEILALPVAGPWIKTKEVIDYAKTLSPKICFPVHDGMLKIPMPYHRMPEIILTPLGINFQVLSEGTEVDFK